MKKIFNRIWNSSPKAWVAQLNRYGSYLFFVKKRKGVVCRSAGPKGELSLLMPFPIPDEYQSMLDGSYENFLPKNILANQLEKNLIIWDIGAHIGYQSLIFASTLGTEKSRILAFEPNPDNARWFAENMRLNPSYAPAISLYEKALSEKIEKVDFNIGNKDDATSSGGYINNTTPPLPEATYKNFKKISLETTTIDYLIRAEGLPIPDLIKIDVEGAEFRVLQGGAQTIKNYKPELIIEIHTIPMMFHVGKFLEDLSYEIKLLDEDNNNIFTKIIYAKYQHESL